MGMPEVVEVDAGQARLFQHPAEGRVDRARVEGPVVGGAIRL